MQIGFESRFVLLNYQSCKCHAKILSANLFCNSQASATRPRIFLDFFILRHDRSPRNFSDGGLMIAGTDRLPGWADAVSALLPEELLYDAILQRMKCDYRQSSTRVQ